MSAPLTMMPPPVPAPIPPPRKSSPAKIIGPLVFIVVLIVVLAMVIDPVALIPQDYEVGDGNMVYDWTFNGSDYTLRINITMDKYLSYVNDPVVRHMTSAHSYDHGLVFITESDSVIITMATYFEFLANDAGLNDVQRANMVLAFVQTLPYNYDTYTHNVSDYWNYPIETLYEGTGDCEDKSFLYLSLMTAMGYDGAILGYPEHIAAGIACDDGSGTYYSKDGMQYYYCETTSIGWTLGVKPDDYGASYVIPIV